MIDVKLTISVAPFTPSVTKLLDVSDVSETINNIREDVQSDH